MDIGIFTLRIDGGVVELGGVQSYSEGRLATSEMLLRHERVMKRSSRFMRCRGDGWVLLLDEYEMMLQQMADNGSRSTIPNFLPA
jgi:hypothetical protein